MMRCIEAFKSGKSWYWWVLVAILSQSAQSVATQNDLVQRVIVRYPQDKLVYQPDAVYVLNVAPNYACHIELPEPPDAIVIANPARYEVIRIGDQSIPDANRDQSRTIFVKALQVQQGQQGQQGQGTDKPTTDQTLDTNLTVRLQSGRMLYLQLHNVQHEDKTVYGCVFYETKLSEKKTVSQDSLGVTPVEQPGNGAVTSGRLRNDQRSPVVDTEMMLQARKYLRRLLIEKGLGVVQNRQEEAGIEFQFSGERIGRYLVLSVAGKSTKPYSISTPMWRFDQYPMVPLVTEPAFPPITLTGGWRMGVIFDVPAWADPQGIGPNAVVMNLSVRDRVVEWVVPVMKLSEVGNTGKYESESKLSTTGVNGIQKLQSNESPTISLRDAQEKLTRLVQSTGIRSSRVTTCQEKDYTLGCLVQRYGQWGLVILMMERRLGAKPLDLGSSRLVVDGQVFNPEIVIQPFPSQLETRPLTSGLIISLPELESSLDWDIKVGGKQSRMRSPISRGSIDSPAQIQLEPVQPVFSSRQPSSVLSPQLEFDQDGLRVESIDARQYQNEFWVTFSIHVQEGGEVTQIIGTDKDGNQAKCVSSRERWSSGEYGKVTFIFKQPIETVEMRWLRQGIKQMAVFGPYQKLGVSTR